MLKSGDSLKLTGYINTKISGLPNLLRWARTNVHVFSALFCTLYSVIGMDGFSVNTGIHTGAITLTELNIGDVVQHDICGPHLNELVFWYLLAKIDGVTKGPGSLSSPLGSTLHQDNWKDPVV